VRDRITGILHDGNSSGTPLPPIEAPSLAFHFHSLFRFTEYEYSPLGDGLVSSGLAHGIIIILLSTNHSQPLIIIIMQHQSFLTTTKLQTQYPPSIHCCLLFLINCSPQAPCQARPFGINRKLALINNFLVVKHQPQRII
jgi:hypothetical protein